MEQPSSLIQLINKTAPKIVIGSSGQYYRVATGPKGDLYVRMRFEPHLAETEEGVRSVDGLQVNVMYLGQEKDLKGKGQTLTELRLYRDGDKCVNGWLIEKLYCPMGLFQRNMRVMHEFVGQRIASGLDVRLNDIASILGLERTMGIAEVVSFMLEGLDESFELEPQVMDYQEFKYQQASLAKKMKKKVEEQKAKSELDPESDEEWHDDPDLDDES